MGIGLRQPRRGSKGSIEAGKLADFAVLSEDPTRVSAGRIAGLEVLVTIIGGEVRYDAAGLTERSGEAGAIGAGGGMS